MDMNREAYQFTKMHFYIKIPFYKKAPLNNEDIPFLCEYIPYKR